MKKYKFKQLYSGLTQQDDVILTIGKDTFQHIETCVDDKKVTEDVEQRFAAYTVIPGFIDSHNHGGYGIDFMNATRDDIEELMQHFPQEGVTTVVPTIGAMEEQSLKKAVSEIVAYIQTKNTTLTDTIGINVEGPFLNSANAGLQPEGAIVDPDLNFTKRILAYGQGEVKIMTIAPELPNAIPVIEYLHKENVVIAAGHSSATTHDMNLAIEAGCNQVTHLCNGMTGLHHRELGIFGAGLLNNNVYAEMAGFDTYSIDPLIWKLIIDTKGANRVIISTDALTLKGLPDGKYQMMDREVEIKDGRLYTEYEGGEMHPGVPMTFIGSVKNILKYTGATLADIITMSCVNPAKQLNIFDRKGTIQQGKDADFIVIDDDYNIIATFCKGHLAYEKK